MSKLAALAGIYHMLRRMAVHSFATEDIMLISQFGMLLLMPKTWNGLDSWVIYTTHWLLAIRKDSLVVGHVPRPISAV